MGHTSQACFDTADNDGYSPVHPADQIAVDHSGMIGPLPGFPSRRIGVGGPAFPGYKIMINHGIHVSGGNQESQPGAPENADALLILPVRLGNDTDTVAVRLQNAGDYGMSKGRVIHIGVAGHIHKIRLRDPPVFHLFSCYR